MKDVQLTPVGPPSKHQLALMIWIAVIPTLTVLNLTLGPWLADFDAVLRTFVLATVSVPIVIYGVMPRLHRARFGPCGAVRSDQSSRTRRQPPAETRDLPRWGAANRCRPRVSTKRCTGLHSDHVVGWPTCLSPVVVGRCLPLVPRRISRPRRRSKG